MAHIAVIDDDVAFLDLMKELARDSGWGIVTCSRENEVLPAIRHAPPDLIVLDLRMTGRHSGWRLIETMRQSAETANIPIIVCSAAVDDLRAGERWLAERQVDVVSKPFELDDFCGRIEAALTVSTASAPATAAR